MKNFFKIFLLFSFLLLPFRFLQAQNLVPNPSFEQVSSGCPCYGSGIYFSHVFNWSIPNQLSPDLYTQCADSYTSCTFAQTPQNSFGWQMPKQGFNYAGIAAGQDYVDYREWIETKLIDTLIPSKNYCVNFYVSLADSSGLAISNIGVLFSDSLITDISHDSASPPWTPIFHYYPPNIENPHGNIITDTINWTKIEGTYSPNSKKAYIVLGNFDKYTQIDTLRVSNKAVLGAQNFAYYYIDMVSVTEIKPVLAKNDTTAAACDSIVLGANYDDNATYTWWPKTGVNDTTLANPTAQTSVTTTYHVKKVQCSSITYDSITVVRAGACTVGIKKLTRNNNQVAVYPNPNSGSFNINYTGVGKQLTIEVYNMLGALITSKQATIDNSQLLTEITNLNEGVYMLRFIVDGLALKTQRVIVTK